MMTRYFAATVYARQQPKPLAGDEIYPNGCVGITFKPTQLTYSQLKLLIADLMKLAKQMERRSYPQG